MTTFGFGAAAKAAAGVRNDPYGGFGFLVEVEGLIAGGFTAVSGLQIETSVESYSEGGLNDYDHRLAGRTAYPGNVVLEAGLTDYDVMWRWCDAVRQGPVERRNATIYLLDRTGAPAMWWDVMGCYPVKWSGPQLRADSNAVATETVELAHRGIVKPAGSSAMSAARLAMGAALNVSGR